jgi:hypothetical protein
MLSVLDQPHIAARRSLGPVALLLAALSVTAPASAQAQVASLQNCATGELPIGVPGDIGYAWKQAIVDWLALNQAADFKWVDPPAFVDPVNAYGAGSSPWGNTCAFGTLVAPAPWPGVGPAEQLHIEQYWLLVREFGVPWSWFNHDPQIYTLDEMVDEASCSVLTPGLAWGDSLAFFANWEYAGNPFRPGTDNSNVLKRRLAAWLGLQLVMLDYAHRNATVNFTPAIPAPGAASWQDMNNGAELSAQLGLMAWTFGHVRDVLDPATDLAMQDALITYARRVNVWNPYHQQNNRGIRSTHALRYVWEATQSPDVWAWYQAALYQFYSPFGNNWSPSGYWSDDFGLDLRYGGACSMSAQRTLSEDPNMPSYARDAIEVSQELIAHLALPDVDSRWVAPNPFNSRTSSGSITGVAPSVREGYYGGVERYLLGFEEGLPYSAATLRDVYVLGPQGNLALDPRAADFHENLACMGAGFNGYLNMGLGASPEVIAPVNQGAVDARGQSPWPNLTRSQDWAPPPTFIENHRIDILPDLWDQIDADPDAALMPVELAGNRIRNFATNFVYGRFGGGGSGNEYAAVLHLGPVGQLVGGGESGFGGGQLAYFWTPDGGPTMLGRHKGRNTGLLQGDDNWSEWRTFPLHSVFLRTVAQNVTTSSRIVTPTAQVFPLAQAPSWADIPAALTGTGSWAAPPAVPDDQASAALAWVSGKIPTQGHVEATGALITTLLQPIGYRRGFLMSDRGIWVDSRLSASHPNERLTEAWETFPVWNRDIASQGSLQDTVIILHSSSQGPVDASQGTSAPVPDVTRVEIFRAGGDTLITFDHERAAQVSDLWSLGTQQSRTLMVDRLPPGCNLNTGCSLASDTFRYLIEEL